MRSSTVTLPSRVKGDRSSEGDLDERPLLVSSAPFIRNNALYAYNNIMRSQVFVRVLYAVLVATPTFAAIVQRLVMHIILCTKLYTCMKELHIIHVGV